MIRLKTVISNQNGLEFEVYLRSRSYVTTLEKVNYVTDIIIR